MNAINRLIHSTKSFFTVDGAHTIEDERALYDRPCPSFADQLPYCGYDDNTETFILEDEISRAAVLTIKPIATEGKSGQGLAEARDALENVLSTFDELPVQLGQWVIQEFSYNDTRVSLITEAIREHMAPHARGTEFSEEYLKVQEHHLKGLAKAGGIFKDHTVTGERWGLKLPRTKFVIYRRVSSTNVRDMNRGKYDPARELNQMIESLKIKFESAGIKYTRDTKQDTLYWLFKFFNPSPDVLGDPEDFYAQMTDIDGDMPIGVDLCEAVLNSRPRSSVEDNAWYFDKKPMRFLRFSGLRKAPRIGQISGEVTTGSAGNEIVRCAADSLPSGCMLAKTMVIVPQSTLEQRIEKLKKESNVDNGESRRVRKAIAEAERVVGGQVKILKATLGVYVSADTVDELDDKQRKIITTMANAGISILKDEEDGLSLDSFLIHLPMNYNPLMDKKGYYARTMAMQHAANLSFAFGRTEGSGRPHLFFYNRGGAPVFVDPMSKKDRENNNFGLIVGPPGSGKSVSIVQMAAMNLAMYRPRMIIVEYGNSFGLLADYCTKFGLKVTKMKLDMANAPSLAPFADIDQVLDSEAADFEDWSDNEAIIEEDYSSPNDEERDVLGELELICFLMITGGEQREFDRFTRSDRQLVRDALIFTAKKSRELGEKDAEGNLIKPRDTITSHVIDSMVDMKNGVYDGCETSYSDSQRETMGEMITALRMYTTGFNAKLFNRTGDAFPDSDLLCIDLAQLAQDANRDKLAVAYTALMQRVNYLAEKHQYSGREIVMYTDESHLITSNPLLGPYLVKMVKCFRKLGCWPYFATQNMADMGGGSRKLLSMIEWYYCLNTPQSEAQEVADVKNLSPEVTRLLSSTKKQDRGYTEGVISSKLHNIMFRSVPPSLHLALAMTDASEKAERARYMEQHKCDEVTAAYHVAKALDKARGFENELTF